MRVFAPPTKSTKPPRRASPSRIPPKPAVGRIDDPLEHHADAVADQVMRTAAPPATGSTDAAGGGDEDVDHMQINDNNGIAIFHSLTPGLTFGLIG